MIFASATVVSADRLDIEQKTDIENGMINVVITHANRWSIICGANKLMALLLSPLFPSKDKAGVNSDTGHF